MEETSIGVENPSNPNVGDRTARTSEQNGVYVEMAMGEKLLAGITVLCRGECAFPPLSFGDVVR
ncbi:hypothetical protein TSTA_066790 [Talaromyces stipitatus ATCC 10500]|uniref:Uncharacterized protein n=1 Tax=Talaromyces stipitatus (strain ATCC 10500 / CBS 375.48 / QM 6759 / NRRL 1006) TaxID=441959 RepID=B8LXF3_TALSN|nr:uncharacterized protein TSTA_066790 [Talaromyces stipitatus ATCC 10500]EED23233.1 hypothetical protein TSTA_066790 [Talaromyces stipitatus ATCC 10500]